MPHTPCNNRVAKVTNLEGNGNSYQRWHVLQWRLVSRGCLWKPTQTMLQRTVIIFRFIGMENISTPILYTPTILDEIFVHEVLHSAAADLEPVIAGKGEFGQPDHSEHVGECAAAHERHVDIVTSCAGRDGVAHVR